MRSSLPPSRSPGSCASGTCSMHQGQGRCPGGKLQAPAAHRCFAFGALHPQAACNLHGYLELHCSAIIGGASPSAHTHAHRVGLGAAGAVPVGAWLEVCHLQRWRREAQRMKGTVAVAALKRRANLRERRRRVDFDMTETRSLTTLCK